MYTTAAKGNRQQKFRKASYDYDKQQTASVTKLTLSIRMHVPKSANFR